ncbi:MAG TPA: hypothetical protein VJP77_07005 [Planctomycetota bacterium]|nr:hypothetical protein [Planctomycetota bacterium]
MIHQRTLAAVAAAVLCAAPIALGQAPTPDARVDLRVEGRELQEVVDFLRERSGANIVILDEPSRSKPISLELNDVSWRDALDLAADLAGCVVEERTGGAVIALTAPPRVDFAFTDADLAEVIDTIAKVSGANIVVAPEVGGTITLRLKEVPWRDALDVAAKTLGYTVVEDRRGILRVVDPLTLQAQLETHSYQLRFLRPAGEFVPVINSEFVNGSLRTPTGDIEQDFPVIEALRRALSPVGQLNYVLERNVLVVRDTAQVHSELGRLIEALDVEPAQVFCDVKFVSTTNTDLFNLGVDYGDSGPSVSISGSQIPIELPFEMGAGGFEDSIIANDLGIGPFSDPTLNPGTTVVPNTIFGALNFTGVAATLRLLQRDERTEVVQAPKLIALDGRAATIFVGETIRYAQASTEQGQAGGLNLAVEEADESPVEVGFQLLVVPHIIPGTNTLTMDVIPKETSLSGTGDSELAPPGFDVFTVGASGSEGSIALPRVRSSTIVTSMLLQSGQTAVIGGLTTDVDFESEKGIPWLMDIPILGYLFKVDEKTRERRSLMVFITPTIVRNAGDTEDLLQRELNRRKEVWDGELESLLFGEEGMPEPEPVATAPALEPAVEPSDEMELTTFVDPAEEAAEEPAPEAPQQP